MKKKERLVLFIRILCSALIAGLIWGVIYFISPVNASAATTFDAFEPSSYTISGSTIKYGFNVSRSTLRDTYYYMIYKCNTAGTLAFDRDGTVITTTSLPYNGQYAYAYVVKNSYTGKSAPYNITYTNPNGNAKASDFEVIELVVGTNQNDIIQYCVNIVNGLNISTDYAAYLGSYTSNNITEPYGVFTGNAGIQFQPDVYLNSNTFLTFNGGAALNGGISTYELYVDGVQVQPSSLLMSSSDDLFTSFLGAHPDLSISGWENNCKFSLTLDLTPYAYEDILVEIRAYSVHEQRALIVYAANIHGYPDPDPEESTSPVLPDPEESDSGSDVETEAPEEDLSYSQGYADGYQAATFASSAGVFRDSRVRVNYTFMGLNINGSYSPQTMIVDLDIPALYISNSDLNFKFVWDYWYNYANRYDDAIQSLMSVSIQLYFGTVFRYQPNLIYLSGNPVADQDSYTLPNVTLFNTESTAYTAILTRDTSLLYNRIYLSLDRAMDLPVYMMQIDIPFETIISFWLSTYQMTVNIPKDLIMFDSASYNLGKAAGEKIGFDKGEISGAKVATDQAFSEGKSEGYSEGKLAGIREEQSNEIRQDFKWYDMFFSMFDAQINTFRSIVNFEIFGVNVAGFVLGLVTIGIMAFIIRKVW